MRLTMKKLVIMLAVIAASVAIIAAQGTFKPRNADEAHAWRLYNQYKESKKKEAAIRSGITQASGDIRTVNVGSVPGLGIDPADVARLARLREQLAAEGERQQKLEAAWDKKFFGRYGDLADSSETIYDAPTKTTMDKIQYRLIQFPFYATDGTYTGRITGAPGTITLVISGSAISGTVSGVYNYKFGDSDFSDKFSGKVTGTLSGSGSVNATLSGKVGGAPFTGTLSGTLSSKGVITGSWTTKASETASGTFRAVKK
jgi:hypothetical protein